MKKTSKMVNKSDFEPLISGIVQLLEEARRYSARAVNSVMTATYWEVGRRVFEHEQHSKNRADYGEQVITRLSVVLTKRFGRGFAKSNIYQMRAFHLAYPNIFQTVSGKLGHGKFQTASGKSELQSTVKIPKISGDITFEELSHAFPLPWSHYVLLLSTRNELARKFYEAEALRGGWSVQAA